MSKSNKIIAGLGVAAALGVAAMPFAGAFALAPTPGATSESENVEVEVIIDSAIALDVDAAKVSVNMDTNDKDETMQTVATVSTNDLDGYTLTVKDSDTTTALTSAASDTIPTGTSIVAGTSAWGIKGGDLSSYTAMVASDSQAPVTILANGTAEAADETTTITYGVSTANNQATGTYTDTIVYTAAVK